jgi:hypothetical protein
MRWVVLGALTGATALMYAISLRGNYLYGRGLGQSPEKQELFAWANVAADVWKGFGLVAVVVLWRAHKSMAIIATIAWFVCLATGVNSAIGVYVQDRSAFTGSREAKFDTYDEARRGLSEVEERIRKLAPHRSLEEVEAAIAALLAKPVVINERVRGTVGSISGNCTKHDARTADSCADVATLRGELAIARAAGALESTRTALQARVNELRDDGSSLRPDPVGEFWSWATRGLVSVRDVGFGFPLVFALLIEIVSAFGPAVIISVAAATRPQHAGVPQAAAGLSPPLQAASLSFDDQLLRWLADRTEPTDYGRAVVLEELYADYATWCMSRNLDAGDHALFEQEFDRVRSIRELHGRIRKFGQRYYGLRIVEVPMLKRPKKAG